MRRTALGGNVRGFIMSCSRKQRVHIIVSLLVSAADYRKPTHWQLIGTTHGEDHQSARRHLMRMFCNISRTASPQASVRLLMNCVLIFVWCGTFYASSISMLPVSRSCRLWAPTITFVETNLCFGLCGTVRRSPNFLLCVCVCEWVRPASPGKGLQHQQVMLWQKQTLMLHLFTATTNNALCMNFNSAFRVNPRLNAQICRLFLEKTLPELLEKIPLGLGRDM